MFNKILFLLEGFTAKERVLYICVVGYSWLHMIIKMKERKENQCERFSVKINI